MSEKVYRFEYDCGRNGTLRGLFVAQESEVQALIGKTARFGEALGKHSNVKATLDERDITVASDLPTFVAEFKRAFPRGFGYNPFRYVDEDREDEDDE